MPQQKPRRSLPATCSDAQTSIGTRRTHECGRVRTGGSLSKSSTAECSDRSRAPDACCKRVGAGGAAEVAYVLVWRRDFAATAGASASDASMEAPWKPMSELSERLLNACCERLIVAAIETSAAAPQRPAQLLACALIWAGRQFGRSDERRTDEAGLRQGCVGVPTGPNAGGLEWRRPRRHFLGDGPTKVARRLSWGAEGSGGYPGTPRGGHKWAV